MRNEKNSLSLAVVTYFGYGTSICPKEFPEKLVDMFGVEEAEIERKKVQEILEKLNLTVPDWSSHTLSSGTSWAVSSLAELYPELDDQARKALEWVCTWWWR